MEFTPWPKTPRLNRDALITEKIDGTNAAIHVVKVPFGTNADTGLADNATAVVVLNDGDGVERSDDGFPVWEYEVGAQSRNRLIWPGNDNMGFAAWVSENAYRLVKVLGEGVHFGEWWGSGIQRGYGLANGDKRFSLFNVNRYQKLLQEACLAGTEIPGLSTVPLLDAYTFSTERVAKVLAELAETGSWAAPGFMRPEGVVVFHSQSRSVYKALIENDDIPKGAA